jgi:hypothetical protein
MIEMIKIASTVGPFRRMDTQREPKRGRRVSDVAACTGSRPNNSTDCVKTILT